MADENVPLWAVRLRAERVARQWSKPAMARALYKAADLRPNRTQVESLARQIRGYERGEHFPRDWASAYATAFETSADGLFGGVDVGVDNEDVDRRALLGLVATAATTTALARDAEPLRDAFEAAVAADATDRDADAWESVADDYAREVGWVSPTVLHPELSTDFAELTRLLPSARGTARSRMIHVAAQLAALIAISLTNMGEGRAARRWWRTAARAADQTGDHRAAALVRGRAAVFSLYADLPRLSIVEQAEEAIAVGHGVPCAGVASGHAARAQALGELGRPAEATAALNDLRGVFEQLPDQVTDLRGHQWGWPRGRLHFVTSLVHTCAGNIGQATAAQDAAFTLYPTRSWQGRGQIEMHRAGVMIRAGDATEGARHMSRVLEKLPVEQRNDGLLRGSAMTSLRLVEPA
ncbi:XRE family transcriptional regulator [Actinomadura sp. KC345]|uniref:XRE family transcriptional regulator n=1 Tax=Actinomadura sp. KC345 TaxID=2530371 RepID=UPI001052200C|nr:XRE family transcriptional regulator [Actinomadura sp. KC345]TDC43371.1 XRE family transcriptional regulator [Actinomadura sp. KC345]